MMQYIIEKVFCWEIYLSNRNKWKGRIIMGYFRPSQYTIENALREVARYDGVYIGDNYVTKDHGSYIEINIETDNAKGHVSYDLYFNESGELTDWKKH